jgi:SAM-dependent methyltransferase
MTDQLPLLIRHLLGFYAIDTLAMGRASGALAVLTEAPGTAAQIATTAGLDERNVAQWLLAMNSAGHARHEDGVFSMTEETLSLLGPGFPIDMGAVLDFVHASFAGPLRHAIDAMRTGTGVASAEYAEMGAAAGGVNSRVYEASLVEEWVAAAPGLRDRLDAGGRVADLACGSGDAAAVLANAFPNTQVWGFDPGAPEGAHTEVANLEIVRDTAATLPADGSFDLITCLDALHHLGDVRAAVQQAHDALREGGVFLVAETAMTGDPDIDSQDPTSLIAHAAALMYCMQENLANGGDGSTPSIGLRWVDDALSGAGFTSVRHHDSETGYRIFLAVR